MIKDYHFHIYYDENSIKLAKELGLKASEKFNVDIGRFHEKNVGPHPRWSVQLLVPVAKFEKLASFFSLNRKGLTLFIHPNTGNDLLDHKERAIWMGELLDLNLSLFESN